MTQNQIIKIGDKEYPLHLLSDSVKTLLTIHQSWQKDRDDSLEIIKINKLVLAKNEAALRDLEREIIMTIESSIKVW
jgi:hypothetical protein